jgi:hypothetical protein
MAGLDPAIQDLRRAAREDVDARITPARDDDEERDVG